MKTSKHTYSHLGNIKFRKLNTDYLLTNDSGDWLHISQENFHRLLDNTIPKNELLYQELQDRQFIAINRKDKMALAKQASKYLQAHYSTYQVGPCLFMIILTLRCNQRCLYCQSTPEKSDAPGFDMDEATAKKTLDMIFEAPSPTLHIEFQGGEPLLNWPVLEYMITYSRSLEKIRHKDVKLTIISNLLLMDDKKMQFFLDNNVNLVTSLDGPSQVHDKNRPCLNREKSHKQATQHIKALTPIINKKRKQDHGNSIDPMNAITTITRFSLPYGKDIVDEFVKLGFNNIFLRPLNPLGLEKKAHDSINYTPEKFIKFYKDTLDYILKLNEKGTFLLERYAFIALHKIMKHTDPIYLDMRNPCGAGIGQIAFNHDGSIYSCDEGRMASRMGYDNFKLGDVFSSNYNDLIDNEVTKTLCMSSCLDNHASCSDCVYKPYCGVCPLVNYIEYGNIFPQIPATYNCKIKIAIFDYLFLKLKVKKYRDIFENWFDQMATPL